MFEVVQFNNKILLMQMRNDLARSFRKIKTSMDLSVATGGSALMEGPKFAGVMTQTLAIERAEYIRSSMDSKVGNSRF